MSKRDKGITSIFFLLLSIAIFFSLLDWSVDGFELFKVQKYEFYFQSWVSIAGILFTLIMTVTTFIIYKKSKLASLKFTSLSFLLISFAYLLIGYHTSYCKVCSDLATCSASHNYSNYFTLIALIIFVVTVLLSNVKNNISILKIFSYGLIIASSLLIITLFISIEFMEIPGFTFYEVSSINLQGFVFVLPLIFILLIFIYFRSISKVTNVILFIFLLLLLSLLPQAYHIFLCTECHTMECSEFYVFSGLIMFMAMGILIYAISLQFQEKVTDK